MKPYFSKLLTEKERANRNPSAKLGRRLRYDPESDYDDQPKFVPASRNGYRRMKFNGNGAGKLEGKSLTDVLNPLRGYLRKSVGRPWDDVYSELCRNLDRRSISGFHVFQHLFQYVEVNTFVGDDGRIMALYRRGGDAHAVDEWYVHPVTGILCYEEPEHYRWRKKENKDEIEIDAHHGYQRINGIWYEAEYRYVDKAVYVGHVKTERVIHKKRQLCRKELRYLGVRNTSLVYA